MKTKPFFLVIIVLTLSSLCAENRLETGDWGLEERDRAPGNGLITQQSVTVNEYCEFLNTVALADPYGFYEEKADSIVRTGRPGSYVYTMTSGDEAKPINYVSQDIAMRYCAGLENTASTSTKNFNCCDSSIRSNRSVFNGVNISAMDVLSQKSSLIGSLSMFWDGLWEGALFLGLVGGGGGSEAARVSEVTKHEVLERRSMVEEAPRLLAQEEPERTSSTVLKVLDRGRFFKAALVAMLHASFADTAAAAPHLPPFSQWGELAHNVSANIREAIAVEKFKAVQHFSKRFCPLYQFRGEESPFPLSELNCSNWRTQSARELVFNEAKALRNNNDVQMQKIFDQKGYSRKNLDVMSENFRLISEKEVQCAALTQQLLTSNPDAPTGIKKEWEEQFDDISYHGARALKDSYHYKIIQDCETTAAFKKLYPGLGEFCNTDIGQCLFFDKQHRISALDGGKNGVLSLDTVRYYKKALEGYTRALEEYKTLQARLGRKYFGDEKVERDLRDTCYTHVLFLEDSLRKKLPEELQHYLEPEVVENKPSQVEVIQDGSEVIITRATEKKNSSASHFQEPQYY